MAMREAEIELLDRFFDQWPEAWWLRITEGMLQPTPRIGERVYERFEEILAWVEAEVEPQGSEVLEALANLGRVLKDASLVFDHDVDVRDHTLFVHQWYHQTHQPGPRARLVEEFSVHVGLLHNLSAEIARAYNLVVRRARALDGQFVGKPLLVVEVGPRHAPMVAVEYSAEEAAELQPYPGFVALPEMIEAREVGGFGTHADDTPRDRGEYEAWVTRLVEDHGPGSEPAPARAKSRRAPSFSLPSFNGTPPSWGQIVFGVVTGAAALAGLLIYPWLLGAAIGMAAAAVALRRWLWRQRPSPLAVIGLAAMTLMGAVGGTAVAGLARDAGSDQKVPLARVSAELELAPARSESFSDTLHAAPCEKVRYRFTLTNRSNSDLERVRVAAAINQTVGQRAMRPRVSFASATMDPGRAAQGARLEASAALTQAYVVDSIRVLDAGGILLDAPDAKGLTDAIATNVHGVSIGRVGAGVTRIVEFETALSCPPPPKHVSN